MQPTDILRYIRGLANYRTLSRPPIIIGGCERSGTSLLTSIMSAHPEVLAMEEETWAFCYGPEAGFDSERPIRIKRLIKTLGGYTPKPSHNRWCEKSPANIFYFDDILTHFSNKVKLIYIIRDGRDVVTSIHPADKSKTWVSPERWAAAAEQGHKYQNHPNVITIKYEELITKFKLTIENICHHAEIDTHDNIYSWREHATIKKSINLIGGAINDISTRSIRKFENKDFKHHDAVNKFMQNTKAMHYMKVFGYL